MTSRRFRKAQISDTNPPGASEENTSTGVGSTQRTYTVSNQSGNVGQGNDVENVHTGPGYGTGTGIRDPESPTVKGITTETGSKVIISNAAGGETIEIHHPTGAQFILDADGSIHVMPSSKKGFGLVADKGNGTIYVKGDLLLKGDSKIFLETPGTLEINAGDIHVNATGDYIETIRGSKQTIIDGTFTQEITKDRSEIVAGQSRITVAGNHREQISGDMRYDVGNQIDIRGGETIDISSQKSTNIFSEKLTTVSSKEETSVSSGQELLLQSKSSVALIATGNLSVDGKSGLFLRTDGNLINSAKGNVSIDTDGALNTRSNSTRMDSTTSFVTRSDTTAIDATSSISLKGLEGLLGFSDTVNFFSGTLNINASGPVDMRGETIDLNLGAPSSGPSPDPAVSPETTSSKEAADPSQGEAPEIVESKEILDYATTEHLTTETAKFPNAKRMSAEEFSYYEHQEGEVPEEAKSVAYQNRGAVPESDVQDAEEIPEGSTVDPNSTTGNNISVAKQYPGTILPNLNNANAKLSRHITCGMFTGVFRNARQCGPTTPEVMRNIHNLCYNILDPLWEKYGNRGIRITSGLRRSNRDRRGSKHFSGEAADVQLSDSANAALHAEMAAWIRDHLPYQAILLEVTGKRNLIVHVESLQPGGRSTRGGSRGRPVLTCGNTSCTIRTPGISTKVAQRYQGRRRG